MKAYRFPLAQLQRLRQAEEEAQKRLLQQRLADARQAEQELASAAERVTAWSSQMEMLEQHGGTVATLQARRRWLPHLVDQAVARRQDWQQAEQVAEQQRGVFRVARQSSKVMQNLNERQLQAYRWQEQLASQQELDELAVISWPREVPE